MHLIVYTSGEHKPYLSKQGVINLRSSFAKDIFAQDLLCVYEKQTGHRGTIRFHGREIIAEIVGKINAGAYDNPDMEKLLTAQVISFDKVNQQRHVLYLQNKAHTLELMKKHAAIMGPKFRCVVDALDREIAPLEIASWRRPKGGYFVSLNAMPGTAKRTLALCKEAGVTMTGAGATFPYGKDPQDSNIRIAPSLPPVEELEQAIAVLCVCLKMAALEKLGV